MLEISKENMSQKDWQEVLEIINKKAPNYFNEFIKSNEIYLPNQNSKNPFDKDRFSITAKSLNKKKPGSWIPLYNLKELSNYFIDNNIFPIRSGSAQFFFYKGNIFFDLTSINFKNININNISSLENFIPITLTSDFLRNENAYLNKAIAKGVINHFVDTNDLKTYKHKLENKRLLYGQFGKLKTTKELIFKTSKENNIIEKGFQFEIDMILENRDEIFIFEAKLGKTFKTNFSLLQLYYPYIYIKSIINSQKKIRTIFIDITTKDSLEIYRLVEFEFKNGNFDESSVLKSWKYEIGFIQ